VRRPLFLTSVFIGTLVALANAQTKPLKIPVKLTAGTASLNNTVRGYATHDYILSAHQGQTMTVKLTSKSSFVYFVPLFADTGLGITDPPQSDLTEWEGALPKTSKYIIRVYLVRAEARRKGVAKYTLSIKLTGAVETSYRCSEGVNVLASIDPANTESAKITVDGSTFNLPRVESASGAKYSDGKITFWSKGSESLFERDGKTYKCSAQK